MEKDEEYIGRYRLIRKLGEGGMGCVWLTEHRELHSLFALKLAEGEKDGVLRTQLRIEAERMKTLDDRRIPYLVDMIEEEGRTALVMEYVDGITLGEYIRRNAPLEEKEALVLMKRLCGIVAYLHSCRPQILYRDVKPDNFMINEAGEIRLLDFGTSLLEAGSVRRREICGTRGYAPPEQADGANVHADADVYSLAAVYSYMLSGVDPSSPPFHPLRGEECGRLISKGSRRLLDDCLSKAPEARPQNAMALLERLEKIRPEREAFSRQLMDLFYRGVLWGNIVLLCILIFLRDKGCPFTEGEHCAGVLVLLCLLWGQLRDLAGNGRNFILQRKWNVLITAKEGSGLPDP